MEDNFFRGTNVQERWEKKHREEYKIDQPYDFSKFTSGKMNEYQEVAAKLLEENKDAFSMNTLHELGCAGGDFVSYVKNYVLQDWEISAEDFSKDSIESAKKREPNVNFFQNDFLLNRINKDYGCICMFETIEHIQEGTNYEILESALNHSEYTIVTTVDTEDDCFGEHISHYKIDTFDKKGYDVVWKSFLNEIYMPNGVYHYMIFLLKGKLD